MPRGKSIVKMLLDSSKAALFAGIEIHNKPHIDYRYPTTAVLVINAWELLLKAYCYKYIGRRTIYCGEGHTITISKAEGLVKESLSIKADRSFVPTFETIDKLNEYRSSNVHYFDNELDPITFMLLYKAVLDYNRFVKKYFNKDISTDDNLIILPIGFRLPLDPVLFLKKQYSNSSNNAFVESIVSTIKDLYKDGIEDCLLIGLDINLTSAKKISNADIIAAVNQTNGEVSVHKEVRLSDNPNAPAIRVDYEALLKEYTLTYTELRIAVKAKRPDIKINKDYIKCVEQVKMQSQLRITLSVDPGKANAPSRDHYKPEAIDEIIKLYDGLSN